VGLKGFWFQVSCFRVSGFSFAELAFGSVQSHCRPSPCLPSFTGDAHQLASIAAAFLLLAPGSAEAGIVGTGFKGFELFAWMKGGDDISGAFFGHGGRSYKL
jgi:hypothetical protein